jgi:hypothetical protein
MFCIPVRRCPSSPLLSRVDFLGEMRDFPHSGTLLPHIPPAPLYPNGGGGGPAS